MKYTIFLLIIIKLLIFDNIFCSDNILTKFHQNDYKVKDIRVDLKRYDKAYLNYMSVRSFKYNRTTVAINLTINAKQDTGNELEVTDQAYKFLSNEYRKIAYRYQINLCKAYNANVAGMKTETSKCGNLTSCFLKANVTYHMCRYVIDASKLPPYIPNGQYMVEHEILFETTPIAMIISYCEIYRPIPYPTGNSSG